MRIRLIYSMAILAVVIIGVLRATLSRHVPYMLYGNGVSACNVTKVESGYITECNLLTKLPSGTNITIVRFGVEQRITATQLKALPMRNDLEDLGPREIWTCPNGRVDMTCVKLRRPDGGMAFLTFHLPDETCNKTVSVVKIATLVSADSEKGIKAYYFSREH